MAKISELTAATSLSGEELLPIVVNTITNKKDNKSITIDTLKRELIALGILDEEIIRNIIFLAIEGDYIKTQDFNLAMVTKSDVNHDHNGVYSEKTHTHNYVDLKGLPTLPSFTDEQLGEFCNRVEDMDMQVTSMNLAIDGLISDVQNIIVTLNENTNIKNSYVLSVEDIPSTLNLLQLKSIPDSSYSFTITLDIIGENADTGYCRYRAYLNCLNGTWKDAVITKVEGDTDLELILVCDSDDIIKLTCQSLFSNIYIDATYTQRANTSGLEIGWL